VLSGNTCRFVDVSLSDYGMDLDELERAITPRTRAVVPTHVFGYPVDVDRVQAIVHAAERRFGTRILVVQDCAHSFGASFRGKPVATAGDAALFGLGISKLITSIFGGMLTIADDELASRVRRFRDDHVRAATAAKAMQRRAYLVAAAAAFSPAAYGAVRWIESETPLLDRMSKAYHLDGLVHFPPDHLDAMTDVEARVGLVQLARYGSIVEERRAHAAYYDRALAGIVGWDLPPIVDGATYSHYVMRVPNRRDLRRALLRRGIELGELIQYSVPHMPPYDRDTPPGAWPNSRFASEHTINVPVYSGLTAAQCARVAGALLEAAARRPADAAHVAFGR
jgi:dTDP-4-amino-4,6-dideoxygalactose transaminase